MCYIVRMSRLIAYRFEFIGVAVSHWYDTCFWKRFVMGYADCKHLMVLVETP